MAAPKKLPVYAVIPNYNMGQQLRRLLPTLLNRGYQHIYVIDDHSTDNSKQLVESFAKEGVSFVPGDKNVGAGANRNRILNYRTSGIAHFLDADMELICRGKVAANIEAAFKRHPDAGVIGFYVLNPDGTQYDWNFGPVRRALMDGLIWHSWNIRSHSNIRALNNLLEKVFKNQWQHWWTYMRPKDAVTEQQVGVVVECNMAVNLADFAQVAGFDASLRFHEIHSLALKLNEIGKSIWYVPELEAKKYDDIDVRTKRKQEMHQAARKLDLKRLLGQYRVKSH